MKKQEYKQVKFRNQQNSTIQFDIVDIEQLQSAIILDHSINEHHRVNFFVLLYIDKGEGLHTIDFNDYQCSQGTLLTIRKDQIHKFSDSGHLKGKLLIFTEDFLISYLQQDEAQLLLLLFNEQLGVPKIQLTEMEQEDIKRSILRIDNEYFKVNDKYSPSILRSELHILITKLFRLKDQRDYIRPEKKYLKEFTVFQSLIEKNVIQSTKVQYYSDKMGVSAKTLNTVTRSIVDKSAKAFIDEICVTHIKRLLLNTKLSIKEIAYQSGFEESTNFYKYFKRHTQVTPEAFRVSK
jgi:AraC-like DNA-binding protein